MKKILAFLVFTLLILSGCIEDNETPSDGNETSDNNGTFPVDNGTHSPDSNFGHTGMDNPDLLNNDADVPADDSEGLRLRKIVAPDEGVVLPVKWGAVMVKVVEAGGIDMNKYKTALAKRGLELTPEHEKIMLK